MAAATQFENFLSVVIWCALYYRLDGTCLWKMAYKRNLRNISFSRKCFFSRKSCMYHSAFCSLIHVMISSLQWSNSFSLWIESWAHDYDWIIEQAVHFNLWGKTLTPFIIYLNLPLGIYRKGVFAMHICVNNELRSVLRAYLGDIRTRWVNKCETF